MHLHQSPCKAAGFLARSAIAKASFRVALFALALSAHAQDHVYGGHHEFSILSGYSPFGGPLWGYTKDVRYSPTILRYSFLIRGGRNVQLRYGPEITALSIMHELGPNPVNPAAPITHYGVGGSPVCMQVVFHANHRVQPFLSEDAGMLYFNGRVLSPQGSQFMFTIDFGAGVNLFTSPHNALQLGYRYNHMSNANISYHNPGTDADTFYLGFSHSFTKGHHDPPKR